MIIQLLERVETGEYSQVILDTALKVSGVSEKEKGLCTEIFYGVLRNKLLLEYCVEKISKGKVKKSFLKYNLMIAMYQLNFMESKESTVVWEATEISKKRFGAVLGKFTNGVLRTFISEKDSIIQELENSKNWPVRHSYPVWIADLFQAHYGENYVEALKYFKQIPVMSFRVNKLRGSVQAVEAYITENQFKIQMRVDNLYYIKNRKLIRSKFLENSEIVIQDGSSYLTAKVLNVKAGELVLDACAAPGGKTSVLAEMMGNSGHIDACELYEERATIMKYHLMKNGVTNTKVHILDAREVEKLGKIYDKILLDVPCSGLGVLRKKPEIVYNRTPEDILKVTVLQKEILESASKVLRIGGELVYSTCTILSDENERIIEEFLKIYPNFKVVEIELGINTHKDTLGGHYISIENGFFDGFYIIKLRKGE